MSKNPLPSKKCSRIKNNGEQCRQWAIHGGNVCHKHGGAAPQVKRKAAERIAEAAHDAAALLVHFMEDPKNDVKVRTQIAQDLLNRAGYAGKQSIDLTVSPFQQAIENDEFLMDIGEVDEDAQAKPTSETPAALPPGDAPAKVGLRKRNRRLP